MSRPVLLRLGRAGATAAAVLLLVGACRPAGPAVGGATGPAPTAHVTVAVGSSMHTMTVDGLSRSFRVYRPSRLPDPAPLVVFLHGGFGSGEQAEKSYHWDAQADTGHFVVAYPDGLHRAWNTGGGCCGQPARTGVDDVGFITAMVRALESALPIDAHRVYATGISNGGIMAYTLACRTTLFAAIAPDSATELGSCPGPAPLSVIHIHGTADHNIPYDGGTGQGVAHIDGPSVPSLNQRWRTIDHCPPPHVTTRGVLTTSVATCPHGKRVELITIAGAGHQWPGASGDAVAARLLHLDPPSTALDATRTIWQFFARARAST